MKLKSFKAKGVHGYLNYDIKFHDRLTFLIGINGTGKTSVLKLILGLVTPSLNHLTSIEFDSIKLKGVDKGSDFEINATSKKGIIKLSIYHNDINTESEINKSDFVYLGDSVNEDFEERQRYELSKFFELPSVKIIQSIATPRFIGIDRKIFLGSSNDEINNSRRELFYRRKYRNIPLDDKLNQSLMNLQADIDKYYKKISSTQLEINTKFKANIIKDSFELSEDKAGIKFITVTELSGKEEKAKEAFSKLGMGDEFEQDLSTFFENLKILLKDTDTSEIEKKIRSKSSTLNEEELKFISKWFDHYPRLNRIDKLIKVYQSYQEDIKSLYQPIKTLENVINKYFEESNKKFELNDEGEMIITQNFRNGSRKMSVTELSSGEKQIISMLGQLIFIYNREGILNNGGILIIDEPEISLHLSWQQIFTETLLESSLDTQFILATHSPEIIGENDKSGIVQDLASKIL